jgi:glycosyltransferase involved in cell wall biosynthesis
MHPARILHLHSSFNLGGKEARAVQLMNHFGDEASHVILSAVPGAMGARSEIDRSVRAEFPGDVAPALYGKPEPARYLRLARYMQRFDLVLSYNWGAMDGVMAHRLLSSFMPLPPLIHHEDGFNEDETEKRNWKRNAFRAQALKGAHAVVVPSKILFEISRSEWRVPAPMLHHIPNGINVALYQWPPQQGSFPGLKRKMGEVIVGTIAGLRAVKNLPRLVRAVAAAGPNIRLAIAGEGPEKPVIMAEAERLGIADRLVMPGFLTDPARYVGHFDIFALSSDSEQFPISLVEAMAAGLPAISTDVGDVRNMVSEANRRFIVAKDDEAGFAEALRQLVKSAKLRAEIGAANRDLATSSYDEEQMFARYRKLYGDAIKRADFARQS